MAMTMIKKLSCDDVKKLHSNLTVQSYAECVQQLLMNSIDAGSKAISVRLDLRYGKVKVVDDGIGICPTQMAKVAEWHFTSKGSWSDSKNCQSFGHRGEFLASVRQVSDLIKVESRFGQSSDMYYKTATKRTTQFGVSRSNRPGCGTTVTIVGLFGERMRINHIKSVQGGDNLSKVLWILKVLALSHHHIDISLRNEETGEYLLKASLSKSQLDTFNKLFGVASGASMKSFDWANTTFKLSGYIGCKAVADVACQLIFVNRYLMNYCCFHKIIIQQLKKTGMLEKGQATSDVPNVNRPKAQQFCIFVININVSPNEVDMIREGEGNVINFLDSVEAKSCIKLAVKKFIEDENLTVASKKKEHSQGSRGDPQSQKRKYGVGDISTAINAADIFKTVHSRTIFPVFKRHKKSCDNTSEPCVNSKKRSNDSKISQNEQIDKCSESEKSIRSGKSRKSGYKPKSLDLSEGKRNIPSSTGLHKPTLSAHGSGALMESTRHKPVLTLTASLSGKEPFDFTAAQGKQRKGKLNSLVNSKKMIEATTQTDKENVIFKCKICQHSDVFTLEHSNSSAVTQVKPKNSLNHNEVDSLVLVNDGLSLDNMQDCQLDRGHREQGDDGNISFLKSDEQKSLANSTHSKTQRQLDMKMSTQDPANPPTNAFREQKLEVERQSVQLASSLEWDGALGIQGQLPSHAVNYLHLPSCLMTPNTNSMKLTSSPKNGDLRSAGKISGFPMSLSPIQPIVGDCSNLAYPSDAMIKDKVTVSLKIDEAKSGDANSNLHSECIAETIGAKTFFSANSIRNLHEKQGNLCLVSLLPSQQPEEGQQEVVNDVQSGVEENKFDGKKQKLDPISHKFNEKQSSLSRDGVEFKSKPQIPSSRRPGSKDNVGSKRMKENFSFDPIIQGQLSSSQQSKKHLHSNRIFADRETGILASTPLFTTKNQRETGKRSAFPSMQPSGFSMLNAKHDLLEENNEGNPIQNDLLLASSVVHQNLQNILQDSTLDHASKSLRNLCSSNTFANQKINSCMNMNESSEPKLLKSDEKIEVIDISDSQDMSRVCESSVVIRKLSNHSSNQTNIHCLTATKEEQMKWCSILETELDVQPLEVKEQHAALSKNDSDSDCVLVDESPENDDCSANYSIMNNACDNSRSDFEQGENDEDESLRKYLGETCVASFYDDVPELMFCSPYFNPHLKKSDFIKVRESVPNKNAVSVSLQRKNENVVETGASDEVGLQVSLPSASHLDGKKLSPTPATNAAASVPRNEDFVDGCPGNAEPDVSVSNIWLRYYDSKKGRSLYCNKFTGNTTINTPGKKEKGTKFSCIKRVQNDGDNLPSVADDFRRGRGAAVLPQQKMAPTASIKMDSYKLADQLQFVVKDYGNLSQVKFTRDMLARAEFVGQVDNRFLACKMSEKEGKCMVVLFDQHAVHERIRLERITNEVMRYGKFISAKMPVPLNMQLLPENVSLLQQSPEYLNKLGVTIQFVKSNEINVTNVPLLLTKGYANTKVNIKDFIRTTVQNLRNTKGLGCQVPREIHAHLASIACYGAIKFGKPLPRKVCCDLISRLHSCKLPFQCAHGRPSITPLIDLTHYRPKENLAESLEVWIGNMKRHLNACK